MDFYERPDVKQAISRMNRFPKREMAKLPEYLSEGEIVEYLSWGQLDNSGGLFAVTDRRVMFVDEGLIRSRSEDFPFDRITTVGLKNGIMGSDVELASSGHKQKMWLPDKALAKEIVDRIRERISIGSLNHGYQPPAPSAAAVSRSNPPGDADQLSVVDQLKQLAELRDLGLLRPEEFEEKRRKLIEAI